MEKIRRQLITGKRKTKFLIPLLVLSLTILYCAGVAFAADDVYVKTNGKDTNDGTSWDKAKQTIKNAIGTVNTNGTVHIADGTYKGENNRDITINKNVTIVGQSQTGTKIDAEKKSRVFQNRRWKCRPAKLDHQKRKISR